jgi:hypothetical protein
LRGRVEKETVSLAARSAKLITMSALYDNLEQLLGPVSANATEVELAALQDRAVKFWIYSSKLLPQWYAIQQGDLRPAEARAEYINVHSVFFFAIGAVGKELDGRFTRLGRLEHVDFRRMNREWQGICMLGHDIITRRQTRLALRDQLLFHIGLRDEPARVVLND